MSQKPRTAGSLLVAALLSIHVVYAMSAQVQEKLHIFVQSPRPVADAVLRLSRETGWAITYEDPMWLDPGDRIELQRPSRSDKSLPKTYVHRDGLIDVDIPVRVGVSLDDQKRLALQDILTGAEARLMSEKFSIQPRGGMLHVVPVAAKDAKGVMRPYSSTLEARISMPLFQGNAIDAFAAIEV